MKTIIVLAVLALTCSAADAKRKQMTRPPISAEACEQVRSAVRTYGAALVEAGAVERGFTKSQIAYAKARCV